MRPEQLAEGPEDGVYVHGLYLDGARWDGAAGTLAPSRDGEPTSPLPVLHFLPSAAGGAADGSYECPVYRTPVRAGVLSTTGHSTNFVLPVMLPSAVPPSDWVKAGVALLMEAPSQ